MASQPRRPPRGRTALAVVTCSLVLVGCAQPDAADEAGDPITGTAPLAMAPAASPTPAERRTLAGVVELRGTYAGAQEEPCASIDEAIDVQSGMTVDVLDEDGTLLGRGWVGGGALSATPADAAPSCLLPWEVHGVPVSGGVLEIALGGSHALGTWTAAELDEVGWVVRTILGTPGPPPELQGVDPGPTAERAAQVAAVDAPPAAPAPAPRRSAPQAPAAPPGAASTPSRRPSEPAPAPGPTPTPTPDPTPTLPPAPHVSSLALRSCEVAANEQSWSVRYLMVVDGVGADFEVPLGDSSLARPPGRSDQTPYARATTSRPLPGGAVEVTWEAYLPMTADEHRIHVVDWVRMAPRSGSWLEIPAPQRQIDPSGHCYDVTTH